MKKGTIIALIIGVLVIGGIIALGMKSAKDANAPGVYDQFATCLKDKGVTFYGAWWCPHCQAEKKLFGNSVRLLPYVECSTPDGNNQTQICIDKKIEGYPTFEFADGTRQSGEISLADLSARSSCPLPTTN